jgi:hypothetical protein
MVCFDRWAGFAGARLRSCARVDGPIQRVLHNTATFPFYTPRLHDVPSVITSKAANGYQFKTGQRELTVQD